jgi:hypothetical protein
MNRRSAYMLAEEVRRKGRVYAWSTDFLAGLHRAAELDKSICVQDFALPQPVEGFCEPPIGVATYAPEPA